MAWTKNLIRTWFQVNWVMNWVQKKRKTDTTRHFGMFTIYFRISNR